MYLIFTEKINLKNAFEVPLNRMKDLQIFKEIDSENQWKIISSTVDAQSKIYAFRVDSVHHETFKILGGLIRTDLDKQNQENLQENEEDKNNKKNRQN